MESFMLGSICTKMGGILRQSSNLEGLQPSYDPSELVEAWEGFKPSWESLRADIPFKPAEEIKKKNSPYCCSIGVCPLLARCPNHDTFKEHY